jgi:hypothetical protein
MPAIVTHRSATTPWPPSAQLVLGDPGAIEAQAIAGAARPITVMVGTGLVVTSLALLVVFAG